MPTFRNYIQKSGQSLEKRPLHSIQINMGYRCNLRCNHCHIEAGPDRPEMMSAAVINDVLRFADKAQIEVADITGGAPEINPHLQDLITGLTRIDSISNIILRTNLAILEEDEYAHLPEFFAKHKVELIASMPCYLENNVELQRGKGVYHKNIRVLKKLNHFGYGSDAAGLKLLLVYNPGGNFLPGPQPELEAAYKEHLKINFGVVFSRLLTMTNAPIGRFRDQLDKQGLLEGYLNLLIDNYNPDNLAKVMCRDLISVDWQGRLYDCDFNQVLQLPTAAGFKHISQVDPRELTGKPIAVGNHCFACVAGAGSSCQGSLSNKVG